MTAGVRTLLASLVLLPFGCGAPSADRLVVATNWTEAQCEALEQRFESQPNNKPIRLHWIRVGPNEDPTRILVRRARVDVLLGGPTSSYERLKSTGQVPADGVRSWSATHDAVASRFAALIAAGDRPGEWSNIFARLVRGDESLNNQATSLDGQSAALVRSASNSEAARRLLDASGGRLVNGPSRSALFLLDLLHATLVTADNELRAARAALAEAGNPARSLALFTEAPPWPPASVEKMRARPDRDSLMRLLAEQVAPDPLARAWLLKNWERPSQPIDGVQLDTLARAADGRLAAEPRFRAWLRSEWTAWSRQRYRRVVSRLANARYSPP